MPVQSVTPSQQTLTMKVGDAAKAVSFTVAPSTATNKGLDYTIDTAIATYVDGKVTPVAEGTTDLVATAKDGSGKTGKIAITINPADAG